MGLTDNVIAGIDRGLEHLTHNDGHVLRPQLIELASLVLRLAAIEADDWTKRPDDAVRIPDMLAEAARELRTTK